MARLLYDFLLGVEQRKNSTFQTQGGLFLFCIILTSLLVITMVIFACGNKGKKGRKQTYGSYPKPEPKQKQSSHPVPQRKQKHESTPSSNYPHMEVYPAPVYYPTAGDGGAASHHHHHHHHGDGGSGVGGGCGGGGSGCGGGGGCGNM